MPDPAIGLRALLADATCRLEDAGVDSARLDTRLLAAAALGLSATEIALGPDRPIETATADRFAKLLARRVAREPVSRILGCREFWSLSFALSPATLDPRPDSETLVEAVLARVERQRPLRLLDLGTGSGCLLLALLSELPQATGVGLDRAEAAARMASTNAAALGLADRAAFVTGSWADAIAPASFDVVISNPPYIACGDLAGLAPEVGYDPNAALDGGDDGLDAYRALAPELPRLLRTGGLAALEIGADQAAAVGALLDRQAMASEAVLADLGGNPRVVIARPA